jgi:hypothetical protein
VLDPVAAMLQSDRSAHTNQHVRDALDLIRADAAERIYAVILVQHLLTKALAGTDALARLADSHAFAGLPRVIQYLTPHPDDEEGERGPRKLLTIPKANIVPPGQHALEFKMQGATIYVDESTPVETSRIVLVGEASDLSTEDGLLTSEERGERQAAVSFLRDRLADAEEWAESVQGEASSEGIAARTLRRAREQVAYTRRGSGHKAIWGLREYEKPTAPEPVSYTLGQVGPVGPVLGAEPKTTWPTDQKVGQVGQVLGDGDGQQVLGQHGHEADAVGPVDLALEAVPGQPGQLGHPHAPAREAGVNGTPDLDARLGDHSPDAFTEANRKRRESGPPARDDDERERRDLA